MICNNCGAYLEDDKLVCPYCNTENEKKAKEEQDEYIKHIKNKQKRLKETPQIFLKNTTKILLYAGLSLLAVGILIMIVVFAFSKITAGDLLEKQEKEIAYLEELYVAGDYDAMCNYFRKVRKNGGSYEKYNRVFEVYSSMDFHIEVLKDTKDFAGKIELDTKEVEQDIERCIRELAAIREMEEFDFPYGEKDGVLYVREKYMEALQTYMLLTKEEIENAVLIYDNEENDYMELAEVAISRMEEEVR